jgi:hypothetical protein
MARPGFLTESYLPFVHISGRIKPFAKPQHSILLSTTPSVTSKFGKEPVIMRGGFAELKKKGIKFTSYNTAEKQ